jgi:hypothetical protein
VKPEHNELRDLPDACYRRLSEVASPQEILGQVVMDGSPDRIPLDPSAMTMPAAFPLLLEPSRHKNQYPFGQTGAAALWVAGQRGLCLDVVDFFLGGSVLGMLATQSTLDAETDRHVYYGARVPGLAKAIMVTKRKEYVQDRSLPGFQFERLVLGKPPNERDPEWASHFHLHLLKIGAYKVLVTSEIDAATGAGDDPVEVKFNSPYKWNVPMVFQLVSGGMAEFVHGDRRTRVIRSVSLSSLVAHATGREGTSVQQLESNILRGLAHLDAALSSLEVGTDYQVLLDATTRDWRAVSVPVELRGPSRALLPPARAVRQLLGRDEPGAGAAGEAPASRPNDAGSRRARPKAPGAAGRAPSSRPRAAAAAGPDAETPAAAPGAAGGGKAGIDPPAGGGRRRGPPRAARR